MVPVRWERPGSHYHGVVHLVSRTLVQPSGEQEKVVVLWPHKGGKGSLRCAGMVSWWSAKTMVRTAMISCLHCIVAC